MQASLVSIAIWQRFPFTGFGKGCACMIILPYWRHSSARTRFIQVRSYSAPERSQSCVTPCCGRQRYCGKQLCMVIMHYVAWPASSMTVSPSSWMPGRAPRASSGSIALRSPHNTWQMMRLLCFIAYLLYCSVCPGSVVCGCKQGICQSIQVPPRVPKCENLSQLARSRCVRSCLHCNCWLVGCNVVHGLYCSKPYLYVCIQARCARILYELPSATVPPCVCRVVIVFIIPRRCCCCCRNDVACTCTSSVACICCSQC